MKILVVPIALTGLIPMAYAGSPDCRADVGAQARCQAVTGNAKKPVSGNARRTPDGSGLTAADKELLDRAATRSLLESIDSQLRRQRLGQ